MEEELQVVELLLRHGDDRRQVEELLSRHGLRYEPDLEAAFGVTDGEGRLVGCGCGAGGLLKCFAVDPELRGNNVLGQLLTRLIQNRFEAGYYDLFVVTRPKNEEVFAQCGFWPVAGTEAVTLMENRPDGPERFAAPFSRPEDAGKIVGAIVMNCNPFTLGHRRLVEYAAQACQVLHLFVVEEDRSQFPTGVRLRLVREGVADLPHVRVHLSGRYMISAATFPTYFLKEDEDAAALQSELDITLFARRLAPALKITTRFAGQEPLDPVTARYNAAMARILPNHGVDFVEIPRAALNGAVISASRVRALLSERGVCPEVLALVPSSTAAYLQTEFQGLRK